MEIAIYLLIGSPPVLLCRVVEQHPLGSASRQIPLAAKLLNELDVDGSAFAIEVRSLKAVQGCKHAAQYVGHGSSLLLDDAGKEHSRNFILME